MRNQDDSNAPPNNGEEQSPSKSPMTQTTPHKAKMSHESNDNPDGEKNVSKELAREFRWVEFAQIASNVILAVVGIIALCIYRGQLQEMRKSTKAAQIAAMAAKSAADTAHATLKSAQKSFEIDQRPYLVTEVPVFSGAGLITEQNITANLTIKNLGRTPARKAATNIKLLPFRPWPKQRPHSRERFIKFIESAFADLRGEN